MAKPFTSSCCWLAYLLWRKVEAVSSHFERASAPWEHLRQGLWLDFFMKSYKYAIRFSKMLLDVNTQKYF